MITTVKFALTSGRTTFTESDDGKKVLEGLAVPFGVASGPSADGGRYIFTTPPTNADELIDVVREHDDDALIGKLDAPMTLTETGLTAVARIFDTSRGRDAATEAREGARVGFSIAADIADFDEDAEGVRTVNEWSAAHLGLVRRPAFPSATLTRIAASAQKKEHNPMTDTTTPEVVEIPTIPEIAEQVAAHLEAQRQQPTSLLAQFGSYAEYVAALRTEKDKAKRDQLQAEFAVPDQTLADNPGLQRPTWRNEIKMNLDARQPLIRGFGTVPQPEGLTSTWPVFNGSLDNIIADQSAEKQELSGVKINITSQTSNVRTAGAVSDISYQLLERATPGYLAAYDRILGAAIARYSEKQFTDAVLAGGTRVEALPALNRANVKALLFEASADVEDAIGAAATRAYVSRDVWVELGGSDDFESERYGTQNAAGVNNAATLRVNIHGLDIERAPWLPADTLIVSHPDAAKFSTTGQRIADAEDVRRLGRDVAHWLMYSSEIYFPSAIRVYGPAAAPAPGA